MRFPGFALLALCSLIATLPAQPPSRRPLKLDDMFRIQDVGEPQCSPDGQWIAYTVSQIDKEADKRETHLWMVSWDGQTDLRLTYGVESESAPRWSPDGKYLSFQSSRTGKAKGAQIWALDRRGGEARQLTDVKARISEYQWTPDSKKLVLVMREPDEPEPDTPKPAANGTPAAPAPPKPPKPIVLDRYHFKQDVQGYLSSDKKSRIYLYDLETKKAELVTTDKTFDETNAVISPDGSKIAYISNHEADPDRTHNSDVWVVDAKPGSTPRRLTTYPGPDAGRLAWSPDSKLVAYLQGSDPKYGAYNINKLALAPVDGGAPRLLTEKLDRNVASPVFSADGRRITFLVSDDRSEYPASMPAAGGSVERLIGSPIVISGHCEASGHRAVLAATDNASNEIFAQEGGSLRKLTAHNDALFAELQLGATEEISFTSSEGTEVHGLLTKPAGYEAGKKYPTLLRIHGGPNGQDAHQFSLERQFFAANGYAVIAVNYRGSAGRGAKFQESIFADWGHKEVIDLLAGVDHVLKMGVADPERLGIGGWSYGGILTDYTIATDGRFKAAISGAGSANQISMYGIDQYTYQYDNEIGPPWKAQDRWIQISYPFFHADRIHTPTLFMGGEKDFNVPIAGGEQMYQALRSLGVPTQMVVYPGEFHGFQRPSFIKDRFERYLAWYDKYLKPQAQTAVTEGSRR